MARDETRAPLKTPAWESRPTLDQLETKIEVWSFYCKRQTRFEVNGFPLPVLRFAGIAAAMFAFTHPLPPILAEELSSKLRFFYTEFVNISSQTWDCDVLGCKKPWGKSISSGSWSSRSNAKTSNRKPDDKALVTWLPDVRCSQEMPKTSILRFLLLNLFSSRRPM